MAIDEVDATSNSNPDSSMIEIQTGTETAGSSSLGQGEGSSTGQRTDEIEKLMDKYDQQEASENYLHSDAFKKKEQAKKNAAIAAEE